MRQGVRIAIDLGQVRIGVARCDAGAILALPVETVYRAHDEELVDIVEICKEYNAMEIILGLPLHMNGSEGENARDVRQWGAKLKKMLPDVPIRLVDERMSSKTAHSQLSAAGRSSRQHRKVIDQQAAITILEAALAQERARNEAPGKLLEEA